MYRGLGVREVWFWRNMRLELYELVHARYVKIPKSNLLPTLDLDAIVEFASMDNHPEAVQLWLARLRGE